MVGTVKRVSFGEKGDPLLVQVVCYVDTRDELDDEELLDKLYFSKNDYRNNRVAAKAVAQELENVGRADALRNSFVEKSKTAQEELNGWTTDDHEGRGVERWACRHHGDQRQVEQFAAIMTVLETQEKLKLDDHKSHSSKDVWKHLGKVASKASRKARHFARMMGKADSHAMAQMIKNDQQQQQATLKIQNMAYLMAAGRPGTKQHAAVVDDNDNDSINSTSDSLGGGDFHNRWMTAGESSLLLDNNSSDDEGCGAGGAGGPGDYDDIDILFSSIEDVMAGGATGTTVPSTPKSKHKKLRILKKIKRRMSATGTAGTSDSLHRRTIPMDLLGPPPVIHRSPLRRRASTSTQSAAEIALRNPMITTRRSSMPLNNTTSGSSSGYHGKAATPSKSRTTTPTNKSRTTTPSKRRTTTTTPNKKRTTTPSKRRNSTRVNSPPEVALYQ